MTAFPISFPVAKPEAVFAAQAVGIPLFQDRDGSWKVEANDDSQLAAWQAWLDQYDPLIKERNAAKAKVDEEADRRVRLIASDEQQKALTARGVELLNKKLMLGQDFNSQDQADAAIALIVFGKTKLVRAAAVSIKADLDALQTSVELVAYDSSTDSRWPTFP